MVNLRCEAAGCSEVKTAEDMPTCIALMQLHQKNVHDQPETRQKPPEIARPTLQQGISEEDWEAFTRRWALFCRETKLPTDRIPAQLMACCELQLEAALFRQDPSVASKCEADILDAMKQLAVMRVALSTRRATLLQTCQDHGEHVRQYVSRLRGLANVCQWTKSGPCRTEGCTGSAQIDYTEDIVKLVLLNGIADDDIRKDVLGTTDIDNRSLSDTVALIDGKETAARAMAADGHRVAATAYKKAARTPQPLTKTAPHAPSPSEIDSRPSTFRCACGRVTPRFGRVRGRPREFKMCLECWRRANPRLRESATSAADRGPTEAMFQHLAAIDVAADDTPPAPPITGRGHHAVLSLADHHIFDGSFGWMACEASPHPTLQLTVGVDDTAYSRLNLPAPPRKSASITAIADSGAQTCLMGLSVLRRLGLRREHLTRVSKRILAANDEEVNVLGAVFLTISGRGAQDQCVGTSAMVYVTDSTSRFYVSKMTLVQLGVLSTDFPRIGAAVAAATSQSGERGHVNQNGARDLAGAAPTPTSGDDDKRSRAGAQLAACGCPTRARPPGRPASLPIKPSPANCDRMKAWLLDRYAASTFNTCPHQPLPAMTGPPMRLRVDPQAEPVVTKRPPNVPVHWQDEVARQLERDVALGVIERVPPNTPVTWMHNMVLAPKPDGSPRRTVDLQPLNRHSVRETHHTVPPFKQARAIPPRTFKTVTDAWNGFHSIAIEPDDRHKTTFLTEQGRFRYKRAPMGFLASQDAYTERFDAIIADVPRKSKCVDDTILWDRNLEEHWWRVISYLELVGKNGIVLNPTKFQFSASEVDFAGFHITTSEVKPLAKYLDAIATFPRPTSISDVRAWFGLVNQVSHYGRTTRLMEPFKPLLSPKTPFYWSPELEKAFTHSKTAISDEIREGVQIFDPSRRTCLSPDWSTTGVGYWLHQQHCSCRALTPGCCPGGWRVTLAGSRFLRDAEKRYAPVEGEALAVAWALEDSRFFTMGCRDLVVASDHKPLTKLLGDRELADIQNPRLFRLKQRTLMWRYRIVHVPGNTIPAADAASRYPSATTRPSDDLDVLAAIRVPADTEDDLELAVIANAQTSANALGATTWERVRTETRRDDTLQRLATLVQSGFPASRDDIPETLQPFWQLRERLSTVDDVVMMDDRVVVPPALQPEVLRALHAAHQGTSKMSSRAQSAVFWPGISRDIEATRAKCHDCWRMTPSQPPMPPVPPCVPTRPFQAIAADYCVARGKGYLVVVDRFSGWPHIVTTQSGAAGFGRAPINYFASYGVPEELSTDGGPEFAAKATATLLQRWGVRHRLSSAHHPRSNGRAEVAVKSMKRLLTSHTAADGDLDTEAVAAGLLTYRNTPDTESGLSPAQIVFGRNLRDLLPVAPQTQVFTSAAVHPTWREAWAHQEEALRLRFARQVDILTPHTRRLPPLIPGTTVLLQNQAGPHAKRWDRTGVVVETMPHDQYLVKVHGSGRITMRNRQYLRHIQPLHSTSPVAMTPTSTSSSPAGTTIPREAPPTDTALTPPDTSGSPPSDLRVPDGNPELRHSAAYPAAPTAPPEPLVPSSPSRPADRRSESSGDCSHPTPLVPSDAPARPKRARKPPGYLADYECDLPH